jgi:hypothetical protein
MATECKLPSSISQIQSIWNDGMFKKEDYLQVDL